MAPWLLALLTGSRRLVTQTFTANATFTVPYGVSNLATVAGQGAAGNPATPGTPGQTGWHKVSINTFQRRDGGTEQTGSTFPSVFDGSPKPDNYCDPTITYTMEESTVYSSLTTCYSFFTDTQPGTPGTAATTGASAIGFGKTFPGGTGGAGTTTSFTNVAVTENTPYTLTIPAGGSITFTYYA